MADTGSSIQRTRNQLPPALVPAPPEDVQTAIFAIGEAIGAALRLSGGQGSYDEASGEPLDSDAETEAHALTAQGHLDLLADKIEAWQRGLLIHALEAYKDHLYYDASAGFEYHGIDEEERGVELQARFDAVCEIARKLVPNLDKAAIMQHGLRALAEDLREAIPALRAEASGKYRSTPEEWEKNHNAEQAILALSVKEGILDQLLYHLENPDHAGAYRQSEPAPGPPHDYAVILYYEDQEPREDTGTTIHTTSTKGAAELRKSDLEAGVPVGAMLPRREEIEAGTLAVEWTGLNPS